MFRDVGLSGELLVRLDGARLAEHLATLDGFLVDAAQEAADVVASFTRVEQLAEHFDAGNDRLLRIAKTDDLDFFADLDDAAFDTARDDGARDPRSRTRPSIGIRNGWSFGRSGIGMNESIAS